MPETSKVADLKSKSDEFLECYDFGHSWARLGYFNWSGNNGICRRYYCTRCTTERDDYFRRLTAKSPWTFMDRRYFYPDEYKKRGSGRVSKKDIHNEVIRRVIENNEILKDEDWDLAVLHLADL